MPSYSAIYLFVSKSSTHLHTPVIIERDFVCASESFQCSRDLTQSRCSWVSAPGQPNCNNELAKSHPSKLLDQVHALLVVIIHHSYSSNTLASLIRNHFNKSRHRLYSRSPHFTSNCGTNDITELGFLNRASQRPGTRFHRSFQFVSIRAGCGNLAPE